MNWRAEFEVHGKWYGNAIVVRTREEAVGYALDKYRNWTAPTDWRVVETDDDALYMWDFEDLVLCPWYAAPAASPEEQDHDPGEGEEDDPDMAVEAEKALQSGSQDNYDDSIPKEGR